MKIEDNIYPILIDFHLKMLDYLILWQKRWLAFIKVLNKHLEDKRKK